MTGDQLVFRQIVVAPFSTDSGTSYSTLGLSKDGKVYRYDPKCEGWVPWPMVEVECRKNHRARR